MNTNIPTEINAFYNIKETNIPPNNEWIKISKFDKFDVNINKNSDKLIITKELLNQCNDISKKYDLLSMEERKLINKPPQSAITNFYIIYKNDQEKKYTLSGSTAPMEYFIKLSINGYNKRFTQACFNCFSSLENLHVKLLAQTRNCDKKNYDDVKNYIKKTINIDLLFDNKTQQQVVQPEYTCINQAVKFFNEELKKDIYSDLKINAYNIIELIKDSKVIDAYLKPIDYQIDNLIKEYKINPLIFDKTNVIKIETNSEEHAKLLFDKHVNDNKYNINKFLFITADMVEKVKESYGIKKLEEIIFLTLQKSLINFYEYPDISNQYVSEYIYSLSNTEDGINKYYFSVENKKSHTDKLNSVLKKLYDNGLNHKNKKYINLIKRIPLKQITVKIEDTNETSDDLDKKLKNLIKKYKSDTDGYNNKITLTNKNTNNKFFWMYKNKTAKKN